MGKEFLCVRKLTANEKKTRIDAIAPAIEIRAEPHPRVLRRMIKQISKRCSPPRFAVTFCIIAFFAHSIPYQSFLHAFTLVFESVE